MIIQVTCGGTDHLHSSSNVLSHRETPSSWLLHPQRLYVMLLFCMHGMGYNFPPRL